jgi:hypothetical protein
MLEETIVKAFRYEDKEPVTHFIKVKTNKPL